MIGSASFDEQSLRVIRRAYAKQMLALAGIQGDTPLEGAFATVQRERYLGDPPWLVLSMHGGGYQPLPSCDPVLAYQNINFALAPERGVNNGSPVLHAGWLHQAGLRRGDRVAHIGAGTGYYTALIAHLVGDTGHVCAVEFDGKLANLARTNLAHLRNITVIQGDGGEWPREPVDLIYVNFLVQQPAETWIESLKAGGRLILPLGVPRAERSPTGGLHTLYGAGLRIQREKRGFSARSLGAAYFVCAEGSLAGSPAECEALKAAFERGGLKRVQSLQWKQPVNADRCWYVGSCWSLSYDQAG